MKITFTLQTHWKCLREPKGLPHHTLETTSLVNSTDNVFLVLSYQKLQNSLRTQTGKHILETARGTSTEVVSSDLRLKPKSLQTRPHKNCTLSLLLFSVSTTPVFLYLTWLPFLKLATLALFFKPVYLLWIQSERLFPHIIPWWFLPHLAILKVKGKLYLNTPIIHSGPTSWGNSALH